MSYEGVAAVRRRLEACLRRQTQILDDSPLS